MNPSEYTRRVERCVRSIYSDKELADADRQKGEEPPITGELLDSIVVDRSREFQVHLGLIRKIVL